MGGGPWYWIYNVVLHLGALVCLPFWLFVRIVRGRYKGQFRERMGILEDRVTAAFGGRPAVWIHAASAGETAAAAPLVRRLRAAFPDSPFLFTVTSRYGKEMAERRLSEWVDAICFSPLDLPLFCRRFVARVRPALYVMVETDLWPNLVRLVKARDGQVVVASGHAGPRTFPRGFWRAVLRHVDLFLMQTDVDARHIIARGARADRVEVFGNLKFDGSGAPAGADALPGLRTDFGLPDGPVLVAGSTLAEDEAPVLDAVARTRRDGVDLRAIVAPRRQERVPEVEKACEARGLSCARRTAGGGGEVLILDTMGELARSYNLASVAYVGGGLTPEVGLHNLIEPLVCGVPVLFGPHQGKAKKVAAELLDNGAGVEVKSASELAARVRQVLKDGGFRSRLAEAGARVLARHRGAAERQVRRLQEFLA